MVYVIELILEIKNGKVFVRNLVFKGLYIKWYGFKKLVKKLNILY